MQPLNVHGRHVSSRVRTRHRKLHFWSSSDTKLHRWRIRVCIGLRVAEFRNREFGPVSGSESPQMTNSSEFRPNDSESPQNGPVSGAETAQSQTSVDFGPGSANWCEALSLQIRPWRALRAVSQLSTQISKKWFFWRFGESKLPKRGLLAKDTRFYYLSSTQKSLHSAI